MNKTVQDAGMDAGELRVSQRPMINDGLKIIPIVVGLSIDYILWQDWAGMSKIDVCLIWL